MVEVAGAANVENNGFWRVASVTATDIVVEDPDDETITEGAGPTVNIAFEGQRATQRSVGLERDTIETEEVRKDRQFADVRSGFNRVVGNIGYELSLVSYDTLIRGAMSGEWQTVTITATGTLGITAGAPNSQKAVIDRASGSWVTDGIRKGDVLRTAGFGTGTNNRNWVVLTVDSATDITVGDSTEVAVTETGGSITFPGRRIDIGTTLRSYTMQRAFNDLPKYETFRGCAVNSMSWTMAPATPIGGTFDMLGMSAAALADTPLANESVQPTTSMMSAFDGELWEGAEFNAVVTNIEFTLENNRQLTPVVGSAFSPGVFEGRAGISGSLSAFFRGGPLFNKFIDEVDTTITMLMNNTGVGGDFIAVTFPRGRLTSATMDPPLEGPVAMDMGFRALAESVNNGGGTEIVTSMTIQVSNEVSDERVVS
jgi:hypothetical protein